MHRMIIISLSALAIMVGGCFLMEPVGRQPRNLTISEQVVSPEGWKGIRYAANGIPVYEEFDSRKQDGRLDLWRYYDKVGVLWREEHDRNSDDLIDLVVVYSEGNMVKIESLSRNPKVSENTVEYLGTYRWRQLLDTNGDGFFDSQFLFRGSVDMLTSLGFDPMTMGDLHDNIPQANWRKLSLDRNHDGVYDDETNYGRSYWKHRSTLPEQETITPDAAPASGASITGITPVQ